MHPIEALEHRRLLSAAATDPQLPAAADLEVRRGGGGARRALPATDVGLSSAEVETILAQAASQALPTQAVVVADREGNVLGVFGMRDTRDDIIRAAAARAKTAAFFQSREDAFTTRTARFIIQDHFPHPIINTPGGPLYGVQFSTLPGSDVPRQSPQTLSISGDPGGIPLFRDGAPVGGVGVAGDLRDIAPRRDLIGFGVAGANPDDRFYTGREETDRDEAVALAGARGFMAPRRIRSTQIFLDGLRLPFTSTNPARGGAARSLAAITAAGDGSLRADPLLFKDTPQVIAAPPAPYPTTTVEGIEGQLKNPATETRTPGAGTNPATVRFGFTDSDDAATERLTAADVEGIIADAVARAKFVRAAIRKPTGRIARVHISVVDRDGDVLGVFRMGDGTNFSYDVSVQKARTAAFFSDDAHAFSTRAVGFMSQRFFPVGIEHTGNGPLFGLQNDLSVKLTDPGVAARNEELRNGITIFPGGVPLYRNGVLVGAVGVSGDGVDQDDMIAYNGASDFQPRDDIRSDRLSREEAERFVLQRVGRLDEIFHLPADASGADARQRAQRRFGDAFDFRLPYVKFPRNPRP